MRPSFRWRLRSRSLVLGPDTLVMGVLNVTPDSFSDGGRFLSPQAAVEHGLQMLAESAVHRVGVTIGLVFDVSHPYQNVR